VYVQSTWLKSRAVMHKYPMRYGFVTDLLEEVSLCKYGGRPHCESLSRRWACGVWRAAHTCVCVWGGGGACAGADGRQGARTRPGERPPQALTQTPPAAPPNTPRARTNTQGARTTGARSRTRSARWRSALATP
jgi:hypothetical protein